jgi:hypothetical protein
MKPFSPDDPLWQDRFETGRALLRGVMKQSPTLDQFSTWTLAAAAAIISFLVVNVDRVATLLSPVWWPQLFGWLMTFSVLSGFLQKVCSTRIQYFVTTEEQLSSQIDNFFKKSVERILAKQESAKITPEDLQSLYSDRRSLALEAIGELRLAAPRIFRTFLESGTKAASNDPLAPFRIGTKWFYIQVGCALVQAFFFLAAVISLVFFLHPSPSSH